MRRWSGIKQRRSALEERQAMVSQRLSELNGSRAARARGSASRRRWPTSRSRRRPPRRASAARPRGPGARRRSIQSLVDRSRRRCSGRDVELSARTTASGFPERVKATRSDPVHRGAPRRRGDALRSTSIRSDLAAARQEGKAKMVGAAGSPNRANPPSLSRKAIGLRRAQARPRNDARCSSACSSARASCACRATTS